MAAFVALAGCRLVDQRTFERTPGTPSAAALARPDLPKAPIVTISFMDPNIDWRPLVREAVHAALDHQPDARFRIVTPVPLNGSQDVQEKYIKAGQSDGPMVAQEVEAIGVSPDHIALGMRGDAGAPPREVRIYTP
jgi:hypothetical protein